MAVVNRDEQLVARDAAGVALREDTYYSIGGGFIRREGASAAVSAVPSPFTYGSAAELLALCDEHGLTCGHEKEDFYGVHQSSPPQLRQS